ncbi:MAG: cyclodeaminase/cyclohydrolase family protein [Chloroflexi bacterium]|nr:cyclodeaminase/cyclohydrolase family protein [Chloroflexota bacterium]
MYTENTVNTFLEALASSEPVPGGGSTAALGGSLAAALVTMVCNLTLSKEEYADAWERLEAIKTRSEALRSDLAHLVDADMAVYSHVMAAYRLPHKSAEEKAARQTSIQVALVEAARVPLQIGECCAEVLALAQESARISNKWVISDAAASALLAEASLRAALLNVDVNIASIKDAQVAAELAERAAALTARSSETKEMTVNHVRAQFVG